jgi:hypothetical protein
VQSWQPLSGICSSEPYFAFMDVWAEIQNDAHSVTPEGSGQKKEGAAGGADADKVPRRVAMTWAQRLKRVFRIEISICDHCGGPVKIIACSQDKLTIGKILVHLNEAAAPAPLPPARAPPGGSADLFGS